jgi:outer membrane immunogenic protein
MRRPILATALIILSTALAFAADLPRRYPPPALMPAPASSWTGFYLGANVGGGITTTTSDFSVAGVPFGTANNSLSGVIGGGQAGYNWQSGPGLIGLEADYQFSGMNGSIDAPCLLPACFQPTTATFSQKLPWFGTVRARLGFASNDWLIYVTGGYAYARVNTDATATGPGYSAELTQSEFRNGWTIGGGIETALTRNWSVRLEYLYLDFGSKSVQWNLPGLPTVNDSEKVVSNVVRAGLNYRF